MKKKEIIWRDILDQATTKKKFNFQQQNLAKKYNFSLSTVFNALKILRELGAVEVGGRGFQARDLEKFLSLWATQRNINKDIIYKTHLNKEVREIESEAPAGIIYGAYSAYSKKYRNAPADYDKVYFYAAESDLVEIKRRFPKSKGYENLFVIKKDKYLDSFGQLTPDVQTYVDLWNLPDWYAKDFLSALKNKLFN